MIIGARETHVVRQIFEIKESNKKIAVKRLKRGKKEVCNPYYHDKSELRLHFC